MGIERRDWIAILGLLVSAVGVLVSAGAGLFVVVLIFALFGVSVAILGFLSWLRRRRKQRTHVHGDLAFSVDSLREDQEIRGQDLPLVVEGQYVSVRPPPVWVVLRDHYGHLYLQSPPVDFLPNGRWRATNVVPGSGIDAVNFVQVTDEGNERFRAMVKRREFGAFDQLPPGSTKLAVVPVSCVNR
jgi:hypothetical protein